MTKCEYCHNDIQQGEGRGRKRRYCSNACRQAAYRHGKTMPVPSQMALADRWVRWQRVTRGDGTTKKPLTCDGDPASSTDPTTWSPLTETEASPIGDGLGFALGDGFACIDLDHCYDSRGYLSDWAKMIIAPVEGKTYIEISPSGDGLHIWGTTSERRGVKVRNTLGMNIEAYSQGRYMTYTGRTFRAAPTALADLTFLFDVIGRLA